MTRVAVVAVVAAAIGAPAFAQESPETTVSWDSGAPRIAEEEKAFHVSGRIQFDVFHLETDGASAVDQNYSRAFARRAYIGIDGQFDDSWRYKMDLAFVPGADAGVSNSTTVRLCQDDATAVIIQRSACLAGESDRGPIVTSVSSSGGDTEVGFDDAFIQYAAGDWAFTLGQQAMASTMEDRTAPHSIPFNEPSGMISAFGSGGAFGAVAATSGANWSGAFGVYGDDLNNPESINTSETISVQARGSWAPVLIENAAGGTIVHIGGNVRYRDNSGGNEASGLHGPGYRYRARPKTGWGDRFIDTGADTYAQDQYLGAEFVAQHNEFQLSAEYGHLTAKPQSGSPIYGFDPTFNGGYIDLFWSPTGDSRPYSVKDGVFGRNSTRSPLGANGFGAVILGARYDFVDLTDSGVDGGEQKGVTLQATWQPLNFLKFQADYSRLDIERPSSPLSGTADVVTLRSQVEW